MSLTRCPNAVTAGPSYSTPLLYLILSDKVLLHVSAESIGYTKYKEESLIEMRCMDSLLHSIQWTQLATGLKVKHHSIVQVGVITIQKLHERPRVTLDVILMPAGNMVINLLVTADISVQLNDEG